MPVNQPPLQPKVVQLDGAGPFETPPLKGSPNLMLPGGELPTRLCLIVEPGKELRIPMEQDHLRNLWKMLDPLFRGKDGEEG